MLVNASDRPTETVAIGQHTSWVQSRQRSRSGPRIQLFGGANPAQREVRLAADPSVTRSGAGEAYWFAELMLSIQRIVASITHVLSSLL